MLLAFSQFSNTVLTEHGTGGTRDLMNINYICESKTGLVREANQDFADTLQTGQGFLAVVCDGVGGNSGGETASRVAVESIIEFFSANEDMEPTARLQMAVESANARINEVARHDSNLTGMATTVVALYLDRVNAYWASAGDSRIYFYDDGDLYQITKDHSLVQQMIDDGLLSPQAAEKHPFRHVITRAIGERVTIDVDGGSMPIEYKHNIKFLLCSDGVSGHLTADEIARLLKNPDLNEIELRLSQMVEERGAHDNYTFIIISNK